jgi:lipopolysaccharide/colanic/teichoic acid biosynthesis glycosyltransferase
MCKPLDEAAMVIKCLKILLRFAYSWYSFMLIIALAIKLDSRGPVIFKQQRLGANNLRSISSNSDRCT